MSVKMEMIQAWLSDTQAAPAALVLRESLIPVEGPDAVLFPPTFAGGDDFAGGYNIDNFGAGRNVCIVDSVGSQANRIEPLFSRETYNKLVPQIVIKAGEKSVNLLEAGHRAGDAIVRCTALKDELHNAFQALLMGDAAPLATISPTSLIFGVWDSRDTQAKAPRLIASTIRAYDVRKLTRSAVYMPPVNYVNAGLLEEPGDKKKEKEYSSRGFQHAPASASHGGVIADGGIRREATLHMAVLRTLVTTDPEKAKKLQQYLLGLALTAFTAPLSGYLRQGCNLVSNPELAIECNAVFSDGRREPLTFGHQDALEFAQRAAAAYGVGASREVDFDKELAKTEVAESEKKADKKKGKK